MKNQNTKSQLQIFEHEIFGKIRTVMIDDEPWFVGKDISDALGYINSKDALKKHVNAEDKQILQRSQNATFEIPTRGLTIINESGMYSLVLLSKLPQAKAFKRWVTTEVLPSIRKYEAYITEGTLSEMLNDPEFAMGLLDMLAEESLKVSALQKKVVVLEDKARFCDNVLNSGDAIQASIIAKDYGMTTISFNRLLRGIGIQYKMGNNGTWLLYSKYANKGFTKTKTFYTAVGDCVIHTNWTQKGRRFLYEILAEYGIYPIDERRPLFDF